MGRNVLYIRVNYVDIGAKMFVQKRIVQNLKGIDFDDDSDDDVEWTPTKNCSAYLQLL